jgi:high-affinity iron transporter
LPITPLDFEPPYWAGVWLGIFPTVETIAAQIGAAVFVIGSYLLAERVRTRGRRRAARLASMPTRVSEPRAQASPQRVSSR